MAVIGIAEVSATGTREECGAGVRVGSGDWVTVEGLTAWLITVSASLHLHLCPAMGKIPDPKAAMAVEAADTLGGAWSCIYHFPQCLCASPHSRSLKEHTGPPVWGYLCCRRKQCPKPQCPQHPAKGCQLDSINQQKPAQLPQPRLPWKKVLDLLPFFRKMSNI